LKLRHGQQSFTLKLDAAGRASLTEFRDAGSST
jgi:hypothetical protein